MNAKTLKEINNFISAGIFVAFVHYGMLISFVEFGIFAPTKASTLGFLAGGITSFLLNKYIVFKSKNDSQSEVVKFIIMVLIGTTINGFIMNFLVNHHVQYLLSQIIATAIVMISNFILCKTWIFKK